MQPALLRSEITVSSYSQQTVASARFGAARILAGHDDRVLVIVGPCSVHSTSQAIEYATLLREKMPTWTNLLIVMRAYFEKPRTTVGWKGLINDPDIDGTFKINKGLRLARQLYCDLTNMGIPVGSELLDTISPQYISDCRNFSLHSRLLLIFGFNSNILGSDRSAYNRIPITSGIGFWRFIPYRFQKRNRWKVLFSGTPVKPSFN